MSKSADGSERRTAQRRRTQRRATDENSVEILESMSDGFAAVDREWRYTYVNRAAERNTRLRRDEMLGRALWEVFPDFAGSQFESACRRAMNEGVTVHFEEYCAPLDTWFEQTMYPAADGITVYGRDITERKRMEAALDEQQRFIRRITELSPVMLDVFNVVTGDHPYFSSDVVNLLGHTADQIAQMEDEFSTLLHPEDVPRLRENIERLKRLTGGEINEFECRVRRGDEWRWISARSMVFARDEQGNVRQVVNATFDITERKQAEETLRRACEEVGQRIVERTRQLSEIDEELRTEITERKRADEELRCSEAHLAEAQRLGHVGSWMWNVVTGECFWSLEHFRIFGLDPETFKPTVENIQRLIHPEDLPIVERVLEKAIRELINFEVEYRIIRPTDGTIRYHCGLGHPVDKGHGELEFIGMVVDVTKRRRAEEELRRSEAYLAEGQRLSHTGSWAWNVSTGEVFWSQEMFRIYGLDPEQTKPGYPSVLQYTLPEDRPRVQQTFEDAVREKRDYELAYRVVWPDGTIRHVNNLAHPVFDKSGTLIEYVGTTIDTTERERAEVSHKELLHRLVLAQEEERGRIAREMHDQLGQQLTALILKLGMLKGGFGEQEELRGQFEALEADAKQLDRDVNFLVWELRPPALDDLGLQAALTKHTRNWSKHFNITVKLHVTGMEKDRLTLEIETALYRIAQEALNNIVKHARATNVDIILERRVEEVSLIVEDDGVGFDTEEVSGAVNGGLGLTGMRERTSLVGGAVEIESRLGDGVTVFVRIPAPKVPNGGGPNE
jgi:PAS domain S-box-containing protein